MSFGGNGRGYIGKRTKEELFRIQQGKCMYCGIKLTIRYFHIDHKIPVSRGGSNGKRNLQLLCAPCNRRKGNMTDGEFRKSYKLTPSWQVNGPQGRLISQSRFDKKTRENAAKRARRRSSILVW